SRKLRAQSAADRSKAPTAWPPAQPAGALLRQLVGSAAWRGKTFEPRPSGRMDQLGAVHRLARPSCRRARRRRLVHDWRSRRAARPVDKRITDDRTSPGTFGAVSIISLARHNSLLRRRTIDHRLRCALAILRPFVEPRLRSSRTL